MPFLITVEAGPNRPEIPIDADRFQAIQSTQNSLFNALYLEEKMKMVLDNYLELENTLVRQAFGYMAYNRMGWADTSTAVYEVARATGNLLYSGRMYEDQWTAHLYAIHGRHSATVRDAEAARAAAEDCFEFQAVRAIRDHSQHAGLAVHSLIWNNQAAETGVQHSVIPQFRSAVLENDRRADADVRSALLDLGELVDLRPLIRAYMDTLVQFHRVFRDATLPLVAGWESTIQQALDEVE